MVSYQYARRRGHTVLNRSNPFKYGYVIKDGILKQDTPDIICGVTRVRVSCFLEEEGDHGVPIGRMGTVFSIGANNIIGVQLDDPTGCPGDTASLYQGEYDFI